MIKIAILLNFFILWSFSGLSWAEEKIGDCLACHQKDTPGIFKAWVNSKHHQCIDKLGKGYKIAAFAEDSIIESIEIQDTLKYGFVIGIQWHPEILIDDNSFNLGKKFLNKAALSKKL